MNNFITPIITPTSDLAILLIAIFGLAIGSFLNVCIWRVPLKISITKPARSFCPKCETQLSWWENIPVLMWVILRAKCRHCQKHIPGRYPLVEIMSGVVAVASYLFFGATPSALVIYALSASLIVITFIDLDYKIIPDVISLPGTVIGLLIGLISQFTDVFIAPVTGGITDSIIGMLAGGGFFYIIGEGYYWVTKRDGLGFGDVKLMCMTGAVLGWQSVAPTIFVGSLLGSVIGIILIIFKGGNRQSEIPFGPWLAAGVLIYLFMDLPLFKF